MKFDIKDLIVPPCTPMHDDGSINLGPIAEYAKYLSGTQHVDNIFVLGTTGEGQNLTVDERKTVAVEWMKYGRDLFSKIIIHVGAGNLRETVELAKHAEEIEADAIAIAPPTYFKPSTVEQLGDYLYEVAKTVPKMPVLFYHLPEITGANFAMYDLLEYVVDKIPNFAGAKFVTFLLPDFGRCQRNFGDRITLSYGKDEVVVFAALMGGTSFVGATFNYMGKLYKKMFDHFRAKEITEAVKIQTDIMEISKIIGHKGNLKAFTSRISGIPLGPPRMPIPRCVNVDKLVKDVASSGLLELE